jgi:hypothetical protein
MNGEADTGRMMSKMVAGSVAELVQLGARVGVEIEPALCVGTVALSSKEAQRPIPKLLE